MASNKRTKAEQIALDHPINKAIVVEQVIIGPVEAKQLLEENRHNRNLRPSKVDQYARDMIAGNWHASAETIKFDWNGRMIDGQHRLNAIIVANVKVPMMVARGLNPQTQTVIDAGAKRSPADALSFTGMTSNPAVIAAAARIGLRYDAGLMRTTESSFGGSMSPSEVLAWVDSNPRIVDAAALASKTFKGIGATPSSLAFAAMKFLAIDELAAFEFLMSTAEFRTNGATDPRSTLIRTFSRLKDQRVKLTPALQLSLLFRAWNAWREERELKSLPATTSSPEGIRGVAIPEPK